MARLDLEKTISRLDFPPEIWACLDLVGEVIAVTQEEALEQERSFVAKTRLQRLLRRFVNRDINGLTAIYALMRMELVYQAAAHIRLFCENVITLRYILLDAEERSKNFLDYAPIDACRIAKAYLEWESQTANPEHVEALKVEIAELEQRSAIVYQRYTYQDRRGKTRTFKNWCNRTLKTQADDCGADMQKLYDVGYRQLSAYVHGSAWALRRQEAYIRVAYDQTVVMVDFANLIRILVAVWLEWLKLMRDALGWQALGRAGYIVDRCNKLEEAINAATENKEPKADAVTRRSDETNDEGSPRCVLCDEPAESGDQFTLTAEARDLYVRMFRDGADPEVFLRKNVLCGSCQALPPEERRELVQQAMARELLAYQNLIRAQDKL